MFPAWAFGELKTLPKGGGGRILLGNYPEKVRLVSVLKPWELEDVDRPQDLLRLLEKAKKR